jgi:hypothetical protein
MARTGSFRRNSGPDGQTPLVGADAPADSNED